VGLGALRQRNPLCTGEGDCDGDCIDHQPRSWKLSAFSVGKHSKHRQQQQQQQQQATTAITTRLNDRRFIMRMQRSTRRARSGVGDGLRFGIEAALYGAPRFTDVTPDRRAHAWANRGTKPIQPPVDRTGASKMIGFHAFLVERVKIASVYDDAICRLMPRSCLSARSLCPRSHAQRDEPSRRYDNDAAWIEDALPRVVETDLCGTVFSQNTFVDSMKLVPVHRRGATTERIQSRERGVTRRLHWSRRDSETNG